MAEMPAWQFERWRRKFARHPWGPLRDDLRFALLISPVLSYLSREYVAPEDIFPTLQMPEEEPKIEDEELAGRILEARLLGLVESLDRMSGG